jgi:hypothetical protein
MNGVREIRFEHAIGLYLPTFFTRWAQTQPQNQATDMLVEDLNIQVTELEALIRTVLETRVHQRSKAFRNFDLVVDFRPNENGFLLTAHFSDQALASVYRDLVQGMNEFDEEDVCSLLQEGEVQAFLFALLAHNVQSRQEGTSITLLLPLREEFVAKAGFYLLQ